MQVLGPMLGRWPPQKPMQVLHFMDGLEATTLDARKSCHQTPDADEI